MASEELIGKGTYGTVFVRDGKAVKKFPNYCNGLREYIVTKLMSKGEHIIKHTSTDFETITMPLYDTSLGKWLKLSNDTSQYDMIIRMIMTAICYIHYNGIVHADLKPDNILVDVKKISKKDQSRGVKRGEIKKLVIADLGISSVEKYAQVQNTAPLYQDPAMSYLFAHDIYSLGVIIAKMFARGCPKKSEVAEDHPDYEKLAKERYSDYIRTSVSKVPARYQDLVKAMIYDSPRTRPDIQACMTTLGYPIPKMKKIHQPIVITEYYNYDAISQVFYEANTKYLVKRARLGEYCLRRYLRTVKNLSEEEVDNYIIAVIIILESLFQSDYIYDTGTDVSSYMRHVTELTENREFLVGITTPTHLVTFE